MSNGNQSSSSQNAYFGLNSNFTFSGATHGNLVSLAASSQPAYPKAVFVNVDGVIDVTQNDEPIIIRTTDGDINLSQLASMMKKLDRLLCVVEEAVKLDPNNETLMSAYEQFRMVEELSR